LWNVSQRTDCRSRARAVDFHPGHRHAECFAIGSIFNKVGRTTGWTQGPVSRTCVNTNVLGSKVHQRCQTFVTAGVDGGDSGSPVFRITSGDNVQLVGILGGGGSDYDVMSPLASIQAELGSVNAVK
jgi:hypothetical protein